MFRIRRQSAEPSENGINKTIIKEEIKKLNVKPVKVQTTAKRLKGSNITESDYAAIKAMVERGATAAMVNSALNVSPVVVTLARKTNTYEEYRELSAARSAKYNANRTPKAPSTKEPRMRKISIDQKTFDLIHIMREKGATNREIAKLCDTSATTVSRIAAAKSLKDYADTMRARNAAYNQMLAEKKVQQKKSEPAATQSTKTAQKIVETKDGIATIDIATLEQTVRKDANILCERLLDLSSQQLTIENLENAQRVIEHFSSSCQMLKGVKALTK